MKPLFVLRPEPGNSVTAARARALGLMVVQCPLFAVEPVRWTAPDPASFDLLLLTSANALRHGGPALAALKSLAVAAVGAATAEAAREAGFRVAHVGSGGVAVLLAGIDRQSRLLHLAGADRRLAASQHHIETVTVYRAMPVRALTLPKAGVALVHSSRAGARLAALVSDRASVSIVATSETAALACEAGWAELGWADRPEDGALLALAAPLCKD